MGLIALFTLAVGLSMDAFAVSVCKGLALKTTTLGHMSAAGLWFGGFQALMPLIGYLLGLQFRDKIMAVDHWIAFVLLALIGANMMREALSNNEEDPCACLSFSSMLPLAVATSIDALAVGITFAFLDVNILIAISLIGVTTFLLSAAGIKIGSLFGAHCKSKAEMIGGIILILLGSKILLEHVNIL